ncbi:MAG TPA: transaldolase [Gemmatimonadales bacterium]|nr:transaldolase [Gemmatimonadales bacterium]
MSGNPLVRLGALGQSPWYDFITRDLVTSGELARLIAEDGLLGMTTNPTIFEKAILGSDHYDDDIRRGAAEGKSPAEIFEALAVADVRAACELFRPAYQRADGQDGLVSIEVSPGMARDTEGTVAEAHRLWQSVDHPNVMIKIPGTREGLPAITRCIADGVNINITLLFSVERYREVIGAFEAGLEVRRKLGLSLDRIASVASFFVSRVDTKVDPMLDKAGDPAGLRGTIAIANACVAYRTFEGALADKRWELLAAHGAHVQRPLWASTSTKDPRYGDLHYIEPLVAPRTVDTMPPETFAAYKDHGKPEVRIQAGIAEADARLEALASLGIDIGQVAAELEDEGVRKFAASYASLLGAIETKLEALAVR